MAQDMTRRSAVGAILAAGLPGGAYGGTGAGGSSMKIQFAFDSHVFTATLLDEAPAQELAAMLPLDLTIEDYSTNEKIAYLPRKLTRRANASFGNEAPGDLCYYAPWGNLVLYYAAYHYSPGLIRLGRLDDGVQPLMTRGKFPLRATRV